MRQTVCITIVSLTFLFHCGRKSGNDERADNLIIEGHGVGQFRVNETNLDEIIKTLGNSCDTILYEDSRLEFNYKELGLSFYYDGRKKIKAILLRQPFSGETKKRIGVNSTLDEVIEVYGAPEWYTPCESCDTWVARYRGIEFEIERDKELPKFPFDEEAHLQKRISKITIYNTGT